MGVPRNDDFNDGNIDGVGYCQAFIHKNKRCSAVHAFIAPIRRDAKLDLRTDASVTRILFDGARATGVEFLSDGKLEKAHADSEVIVAAGAFGTPQLLMVSGIGPADHLSEFDIAVRADLPGVGENLQGSCIQRARGTYEWSVRIRAVHTWARQDVGRGALAYDEVWTSSNQRCGGRGLRQPGGRQRSCDAADLLQRHHVPESGTRKST